MEAPSVQEEGGVGFGVWVILGGYFCLLCVAGFRAWRLNSRNIANAVTSKESLGAHYLANRDLGTVVLALSTVASINSGYFIVGVPGEAYRSGWWAIFWPGAMVLVMATAILYAPRLHLVARARGYVSVMDFVWDRYRSRPLHAVACFCVIAPTTIFLLAQFSAFGVTIHSLSGGAIPTYVASVVLAVILVVMEATGGLTAVAFTDVFQGILLLLGVSVVFIFQQTIYGGLSSAGSTLQQIAPSKTYIPSTLQLTNAFDLQLGIGFASIVYPFFQARVLAAQSTRKLRKAMCLVGISPWFSGFPAVLIGILIAAKYQYRDPNEVYALYIRDILNYENLSRGRAWESTLYYFVGSIMLSSSVAAIMSTADSLLISLSQILVTDIIQPLLVPKAPAGAAGTAARAKAQAKEKLRDDEVTRDEDVMEVQDAPPKKPKVQLRVQLADPEPELAPELDPQLEATATRRMVWTGRIVTTLLAIACVVVAELRVNLTFLARLQSVIILQLFPTYMFGLYSTSVRSLGMLWGICTGSIVACIFIYLDGALVATLSFLTNLFTLLIVTTVQKKRSKSGQKTVNVDELKPYIGLRIDADALNLVKTRGTFTKLPSSPDGTDSVATQSPTIDEESGDGKKKKSYREPVHLLPLYLLICLLCGAALPFYRRNGVPDNLMWLNIPEWVVIATALWIVSTVLSLGMCMYWSVGYT